MRAIVISALLSGAAVAAACSQPTHAQPAPDPAVTGTAAAQAFVASLSGGDREKAALPAADTARTQMNYVPMVRAGVPLDELDDPQKAHALSLLRTGLSDTGFATAQRIIEHEDILRELEKARGVSNYMRRQPGLYYTAVFGAPAANAAWGWRFEGHHLSVNVTHRPAGGQIVAPLFFGANPARVPSGPHAGSRILAAEEDEARALLALFSGEQRSMAVIAPETTNDIVSTNRPKVDGLQYDGLAVATMTAAQKAQLRKLIGVYAARVPAAQRDAQLARMDQAGFDRLYFAWAGSTETGGKHYYRIHGPTLLIEYDNSQNDANHIHTVWRDLEHDFGGDLLRQHLAAVRH